MLLPNRGIRIAMASLAFVMFVAGVCHAEIRTWINPGDGTWAEPTNWSDGVVPGAEDTAVITGNVTVTLRTYRTVSVLRIGTGASFALLGDGASAGLTVTQELTNDGTLRMYSIFSREAVVALGDACTFANNGELRCLAGSASIAVTGGRFDNFGQVEIESSTNLTIRGDVTQYAGTFSATGRATIDGGEVRWFGGCMSGNITFQNSNLLISGENVQTCDLSVNFDNHSRLLGNLSTTARLNVLVTGHLRAASGAQNAGAIVLRGGELNIDGPEPLVNSGSIEATESYSGIIGQIVNDGVFRVLGGAGVTMPSGRLVQRSGTIDAIGFFRVHYSIAVDLIGGSLNGWLDVWRPRLSIGPSIDASLIRLGGYGCTLTRLDSSLATIEVASTRVLVEQSLGGFATIRLHPGTWLEIDDDATYTNFGCIQTVSWNDDSAAAIDGALTNAGTVDVAPETPLRQWGEFAQEESGVYTVRIHGPQNYSRFTVHGSADIRGRIRVTLAPDYEPELGDEFDILTFGSLADTLSCDDIDGLVISETKRFKIVRTATTLSLVVVDAAQLPADTNCDCVSDLIDLATVLTNFGTPTDMQLHDGDFNADGAVDLNDLGLLLATFGTACP